MKIDNSVHYKPNDESALHLAQVFSFLDILEQIFPMNQLCYDINISFCDYSFFVFDNLWMVNYPHNLTLFPYLIYQNTLLRQVLFSQVFLFK